MSRSLNDRIRNPAPWLDQSDPPSYSRGSSSKTKRSRRFGILDAMVGLMVVIAVWTQTPVGAFFDRMIATATGAPTDGFRPLTTYFETGDGVADTLTAVLAAPPDLTIAAPDGGLPQPWRTAARLVLEQHPPARAKRALATARLTDPSATMMGLLDAHYSSDPSAALELLVIAPDQRNRAIARAQSAGVEQPHLWQNHRSYLPLADRLAGDKVVGKIMALATALDLTWPVAGPHRISSGWGHRDHPVLKKRKFHNGIDLAVPIGTPILSAQDGKARVGEDDVSGRYVVVDHGHGVKTSYCHLSETLIADGARVRSGQHIADSGNTGRSTGPHLHFVVRVGRKTTDPAKLRRSTER